ncbi:2-hydroxyacid dehydrogenase [Anaeromyxobacter oryzisoli]|uniref:2-hydroxyacid dehydrogenase n=1 Tax=Anaeromyxobacter oryzisoli TaxID=2925408 RepID=UPI001F56F163|nr:D-glycerate dehydrogenase [Anaeromyxobacter sp. SG63]
MKPILYVARPLPGGALAPLEALFEVRTGDGPLRAGAVPDAARGATTLVVTYLDRVDAALLGAFPALRHLASYGVGVNHIDLAECRRRNILVTNTPGILTDATADHAMALLLAAARRIAEGDRVIRAGGWTSSAPGWMLGTEVTRKTLGIVGFGRIGQAVARRAAGFEMKVLYTGPREVPFPGARRLPLEALLAESDFVSLHVPLTPDTEHLLSAERIARMKPGAILVNTARGPVVDDAALAGALGSGRLAAAGLDVFPREPAVPEAYLALPNVVLTPHLGSGTRETRAAMARMVLEEVARVARGEPARHPVA